MMLGPQKHKNTYILNCWIITEKNQLEFYINFKVAQTKSIVFNN